MLQAYSLNVDVAADGNVPFNNVVVDKGCAEKLSGSGSIELNTCGAYKVHVDGVSSASTTIQLIKDGVALPQAQSTGTTLGFETYVQVDRNNCRCSCSSPVVIQLRNTTAATFANVNIVVEKVA